MPNPAAPRGVLRDIAAVSARDIWLVGDRGPNGAEHVRTLIEHWDGTRWRLVSSPISRGSLESVAALSSRDIWVSGSSTWGCWCDLFAHRLGTTWRTVETPHIKVQRSLLIDAAGRDDIWAVGQLTNYSYERAVIEHYRC